MTSKEELERIKTAYYSGLKVQIWFNGIWYDYDARESGGFSEYRQYRIVGSDYAKKAEERIKKLEEQIEKMKCGDNCKYGYIACGSYLCDLGLDGCNNIPFNCDKWELKEDVL